ncbi:MAG TPA: ATP synthase F1 subunit delta [Thermodesulfovibrionales bacterium]|nr:ATP synthase F1 subunit delta [Thermodesulfovibrionales bacterium]
MKSKQAVKRCAKMFLNSVGIDAAPKALDEFSALNKLLETSREFRGLLENPLFTPEERAEGLKQVADGLKISGDTVKFVLYLSDQVLIPFFAELIQIVTDMYLDKKKRAKATVVTPVETGAKYDDALKSALKRLTGRDVEIEYSVDPSLLGGVMIKVGSTMYDSSIKGQLRLLKDELVKG